MKIAFILRAFPVISETFIVNQMCALIDQGHTIAIFAFQENKPTVIHNTIIEYGLLDKVTYWTPEPKSKWKRLKYVGRTLIRNTKNYHFTKVLRALNFFKWGKSALSLHEFYKNEWFLKKNAFDIIHCHFAQLGLYIANLKKDGFLDDERLVTSFHGTDINPANIEKYKKNYQVLFKYMDVLTYNSAYSLSILNKITSDTSKMRLLPVGLDTSKFKKSTELVENDTIELLFCGRFIELKGPIIAVEIVKKLVERNQKVHLSMIGTGKLLGDVERLIGEYQLAKHITLLGAKSQEEIINVMNGSDVFLMPGVHDVESGRADTQGLVIQEAQAMQLPVVVSNAGGMKYGLVDGETGFVVPEKDIDGFVKRLESLFNDETLRMEMGQNGRDYVVEKFDSKLLCDQLISYYSE
jgi:colanic acid/amylovoran/stewartan biosynthesis glycosyltransferase WcaL/AmsK/CpsK